MIPRLPAASALFAILVVCTLAADKKPAEDSPARPPLDSFFRDPAFETLNISPDGTKLAAVSMWKEHLNLFMIDMKTKRPTLLTGLTNSSVSDVRWIGNNRILFTATEDGTDSGGLFAIDSDGKNGRVLSPSLHDQVNNGARVYRYSRFLDYYKDSTTEILVTNNERREFEPDVCIMNVDNGHKRTILLNPGNVSTWLADYDGVVRLGYGEQGRSQFLVYRDNDKEEFHEIKRWDFTDGTVEPVSFAADNHLIYVKNSIGRNTAAICLFDPTKGEIVETLFADPTYDAGRVILSRKTHSLLGFTCEREQLDFVWADKGMKARQGGFDHAFPRTHNYFISRSLDDTWNIVLATSDRDSGTFYLLNMDRHSIEPLVARMPWLEPTRLAEMKPIEYQSRDGLTIHGYLTLPPGRDPKNLPVIINPHGGPWARDSWGYNPEIQFLASRGYAVLQMNFRGSTGYGRKFLEAGYGQWGLSMQDDITDGVKWLVDQGIADPKRIAIYGASYGGYATMAGLAFTPDLYRCGINYVGVTDIELLLRTIPKAWENSRAALEVMTGNAANQKEQLKATSPMRKADQIRVPVFFAYGELDDRVDLKHGTKLVAELRKNGVPVELMVKHDEGHGFRHWDNKIEFYTTMEKFLDQYMPAYEPAATH